MPIKVDDRQLRQFAKKLEDLAKKERDSFFIESTEMLGNEVLERTQRRTPRRTGHLYNSWQQGDAANAGDSYQTEVANTADYAEYVEYGHRIVNKAGQAVGWQPGQFMMTVSEIEVEAGAEALLKQKLEHFLEEGLGSG